MQWQGLKRKLISLEKVKEIRNENECVSFLYDGILLYLKKDKNEKFYIVDGIKEDSKSRFYLDSLNKLERNIRSFLRYKNFIK